MDKVNRLITKFKYAGLTAQEMKLCVPKVKEENVRGMRWILPLMFGSLVLLFIVSLIPGSGEETNKALYAFFAILMAVEWLIFKVYFQKHPEKIIILTHIFMLSAYAFGIYEATCLRDDASSTVFCVFLVAVPLLVVDVPIRLAMLTVVIEIILLTVYFIVGNSLGDQFVVINSLACMVLGIVCGYIVQRTKFSDIRNQIIIQTQRDTDVMTGARSRIAYVRDLGVMTDNGISAGVIFADVNGLKKANDTYGHEAGDQLIRKAYTLLYNHFNETKDCIYRIGGDEFVVICMDIEEEMFNERFREMVECSENNGTVSCGSIWLEQVKDAESAVKDAEKMMYAAKQEYYKSHPERDRRNR